MNAYRYQKIDAFTSGNSTGNPAACIYLKPGETLSPDDMLAIARQHKGFVSEVVYCREEGDGFHLAYYSSECEVDFCGHGTIACMYSLIREHGGLLGCSEIPITTTRKGALTVYNEIAARDAVFITAPNPLHIGTELDTATITGALGAPIVAPSPRLPIDLIDAGLRTLIVPVASLQEAITLFPDEGVLKEFCLANGIDIILIYSIEVENPANKAHTRVFAPKFGYLEDPATGSGNSAFGYYMLKNGLWDGESISLEQGGQDRVFNRVTLGTRDGLVLFGGGATTRIMGEYFF